MVTSDDEVLEACRAGDFDRGATLILVRYGPRIAAMLRHLVQNRDEADEIFSSFQEKLVRELPGFLGSGSLNSWLRMMAKSCLASHFRAERRHRRADRTISQLDRLPSSLVTRQRFTGNRGAFRVSTAPWLKTALKLDLAALCEKHLSLEERRLLYLRFTRRLPWEEIVTELNGGPVAQQEVAGQAQRIRKRFSRLLQRVVLLARREGLGGEGLSENKCVDTEADEAPRQPGARAGCSSARTHEGPKTSPPQTGGTQPASNEAGRYVDGSAAECSRYFPTGPEGERPDPRERGRTGSGAARGSDIEAGGGDA